MKNKYFPQTFFQSLTLLLAPFLFTIPILYFKVLKIISNDLFMLISFGVWVLGVLLIFYLLNKKRKVKLSSQFKFKINKIILLFITLIIVFQISIFFPLSYYVSSVISEITSFTSGLKYALLLTISAAIFEELIFRGVFLHGYLIKYKPKKAILISALFFGIIHFNTFAPTQFIGAIILGFITSYIFYYTRSVGMAILLHLTYNLNVYLMSKIHVNYGNAKINKASDIYGNYSVYIIIISFLMTLYTIYYIIKNKKY